MIGIYNAENDTITQIAGNSKVPVWTGTAAEFEALDKSTLQHGTYLNITDDETNIIDDTEAGSGKTYSSNKIESELDFVKCPELTSENSVFTLIRQHIFKNKRFASISIICSMNTTNKEFIHCLTLPFKPIELWEGRVRGFHEVDDLNYKIDTDGKFWLEKTNDTYEYTNFRINVSFPIQ